MLLLSISTNLLTVIYRFSSLALASVVYIAPGSYSKDSRMSLSWIHVTGQVGGYFVPTITIHADSTWDQPGYGLIFNPVYNS
jgi:hypothetical protein